MSHIYTLTDPQTGDIRYIGRTDDLRKRLILHISRARRGHKWYVSNWIRQLLSINLEPTITSIERVPRGDPEHREAYWIAQGKHLGWPITNLTDGGDGTPGHHPSQEIRQRISNGMKGKKNSAGKRNSLGRVASAETREKLRKSHIGLRPTDETREKHRQANLRRPPITEITRQKLSESGKVGWHKRDRTVSDETRKKRSESCKKAWAEKKKYHDSLTQE